MKSTYFMEGDDLVERRTFDSEPYLQHAQDLRSMGLTGSSELKHAASFSPAVVELYLRENGIDMHEFMANPVHVRCMLSDPNLSGFRVWEGRVSKRKE